MNYKIYSWNVNGIRSASKKGFYEWLDTQQLSVLLLQETRVELEQLTEQQRSLASHNFHLNSAEKKGYSGVGAYINKDIALLEISTDLGISKFDSEGRLQILKFPEFTLINGYFPNGKKNAERLAYKMEFYDEILKLVEQLRANGEKIVITGDVNTAHREIDLTNPKPNAKHSGFLPKERAWIDKLLASGFVDSYRQMHGNAPEKYTWWSTRSNARARNVGWRIDYFFVDEALLPNLKAADIHQNVMGSDHCPISIELEF